MSSIFKSIITLLYNVHISPVINTVFWNLSFMLIFSPLQISFEMQKERKTTNGHPFKQIKVWLLVRSCGELSFRCLERGIPCLMQELTTGAVRSVYCILFCNCSCTTKPRQDTKFLWRWISLIQQKQQQILNMKL